MIYVMFGKYIRIQPSFSAAVHHTVMVFAMKILCFIT